MTDTPKANFRLLYDLVMIYPINSKRQAESGVIVTSIIDKTAPREGFVVAIGPGILDKTNSLVEIPVVPGDRVIFSTTNCREIKFEGDIFQVVPSSEILCKLAQIPEVI